MREEFIRITKDEYAEYMQLLEDIKILNALLAEGVDNWDGWDLAMERVRVLEINDSLPATNTGGGGVDE